MTPGGKPGGTATPTSGLDWFPQGSFRKGKKTFIIRLLRSFTSSLDWETKSFCCQSHTQTLSVRFRYRHHVPSVELDTAQSDISLVKLSILEEKQSISSKCVFRLDSWVPVNDNENISAYKDCVLFVCLSVGDVIERFAK